MIFERLLKVFETVMPSVDSKNITLETDLKTDLGVTSISVLLLVIGIEEEFSISFDNIKYDAFNTVDDVCKYIESKL